jgi:rod shape-determining protein MreD
VKIAVRVALVLITATVLEQGVFSQVRIAGAAGDVLLLCAVSAGFVGGPDLGALVGFFAGLLLDTMLPSPMGLAALSYCLAGYATGTLRGTSVRTSRWQPPLLAATGSAIGLLVFVVASAVVGRTGLWSSHLVTVIVVVGVINAVLAPLAVRVMRWALGDASISRTALR